jgi:hypothetical protein
MYDGMLHLHSFLRWAILILLLVAIYKSFADRNKAFTAGHKKTGLFLMICADVMLFLVWPVVPGHRVESIQPTDLQC